MTWWNSLFQPSINRRLVASFATIVIFILITTVANYYQLVQFRLVSDEAIPTSLELADIQDYALAIEFIDARLESLFVIGDRATESAILQKLTEMQEIVSAIKSNAPSTVLADIVVLEQTTLELNTEIILLIDILGEADSGATNQQVFTVVNLIDDARQLQQGIFADTLTQVQNLIFEEEQIATTMIVQLVVLAIIASSVAVAASFFTSRSVARPIEALATVAQDVRDGNLTARANVSRGDEIGLLAQTFNNMTEQLSHLIENLEQRVQERTRDLNIASQVSQQVTRVLDMKQLLPYLSNLTQEGFNLSHVSVFVYDSKSNLLHLQAGSGKVGEKMLEAGKQFRLDDKGLVPLAARTSEEQIISDVVASPDHVVNPLLPHTKSEMAVPMRVGTQLIGVLDMQSDEVEYFTEEQVNILKALADQIAVAVRNAASFRAAEESRAEAEQASVVKSQFLASMSHELRTPLNAVINFTKFVAQGDLGPINDQQEEMLFESVDSAKHLLSLINDVLDMSKIESGSLTLFVQDNVNLTDILSNVVSTGKMLLDNKPVMIETEIADDISLIRGDKQRIRQIILNVMSNACKFTDTGHIALRANANGDEVTIAIEDTGSGIALEDQASVFEPFKQTDSGLRKGGGTGLGMPISKNLAEIHGGRLWLESNPGQGTTFYVMLPIKSDKLVPIVT